jgi:hypothetical protein
VHVVVEERKEGGSKGEAGRAESAEGFWREVAGDLNEGFGGEGFVEALGRGRSLGKERNLPKEEYRDRRELVEDGLESGQRPLKVDERTDGLKTPDSRSCEGFVLRIVGKLVKCMDVGGSDPHGGRRSVCRRRDFLNVSAMGRKR